MKITRLLIANRGEIAIRVMRTAREMGIETVAVYSESDAGALHVGQADQAVSLGAGPPGETYLSIPRLLEAARSSGADAVHPGYGFLSENAGFARAVAGAGLVWVGPPPAAMDAMGGKLPARARMEAAGVPVVPGSRPGIVDDAGLAAEAARIGYPLLIKASAGGGGKGMSRVERPEDLAAALAEGRRVAAARLRGRNGLPRAPARRRPPRRVPGLRRRAGQRRPPLRARVQRPAPPPEDRRGDAERGPRRRAARARWARRRSPRRRPSATSARGRSSSSWTAPARFYFLEMNTRLQVEHAITEETLGCDLVRAQLEVAQGAALPQAWRDGTLRPRGHAIELRLYAEDPVEFLPRTGRILVDREPGGPGRARRRRRRRGQRRGRRVRSAARQADRPGPRPRRRDRARAARARRVGGARRRDEHAAARRRPRVAGVCLGPVRHGSRRAAAAGSRRAAAARGRVDRGGARGVRAAAGRRTAPGRRRSVGSAAIRGTAWPGWRAGA